MRLTMLRTVLATVLLVLVSAGTVRADRLFTSGFELQTTTNGIEWFTGDATPTACAVNTTANRVRTGASSLRCQNPSSGAVKGQVTRLSDLANGSSRFLRAYVWIDTLPDATTGIMGFGTQARADRVNLRLHTDGTLSVSTDNGTETVGPGSTALSTGQWYRIELRAKRHATLPDAGQDEVEVKIDGVTELTSTTLGISSVFGRILVGTNTNTTDTATAVDVYFDDVAVNDSSGSSQTSWPAAGSVTSLFPTGSGEFEQTVSFGGSAPAATAWESTDDGTATGTVDGVDYVTFTSTSADWAGLGSRIALAMDDLPFADAVALVGFALRLNNAAAGTATYTLGAQTGNGGTKSTASVQNYDGGTTWTLNSALGTRAAHQWVLYADPDAAAWTRTSVNNLQYLVRGTDASPNINITAMWVTVEYTPGAAPEPSECAGLALLGVGC